MNRASQTMEVHGDVIALWEPDEGSGAGIAHLQEAGYDLERYRVIYRDMMGVWAEVLICKSPIVGFCTWGFRSLGGTKELSEALVLVHAVPRELAYNVARAEVGLPPKNGP